MIRILHVDDCADDMELISLQLERVSRNLSITGVEGVDEALTALEEESFDCIICDYEMPVLNGLDLLTRLRRAGNPIPFVFLTGQGNEKLVVEALRNGANDYFTKHNGFAPFARLVNAIEKHVDAARVKLEKKAAEEALRVSEERYRLFLQKSHEGTFRIDMNPPIDITLPTEEQIDLIYESASIGEVNEALLDMYGLSSEEEMLGARLVDIHGGPDNKANRAATKEMIESGYRIKNAETQEIGADGKLRYFINNSVGIVEDGKIYSFWGTQIDITEAKLMEEEFRRSEARLRALSDAAEEAIILSENGVCLEQNEAAYKMFGFTREELVGMQVTALVSPEDRDLLRGRSDAESSGIMLVNALKKNGEEFSAEISIRKYQGPVDEIRVAVFKEPEKAKGESLRAVSEEDFLSHLVEKAPHKLCILDLIEDKYIYSLHIDPSALEFVSIQEPKDSGNDNIRDRYLSMGDDDFLECIYRFSNEEETCNYKSREVVFERDENKHPVQILKSLEKLA